MRSCADTLACSAVVMVCLLAGCQSAYQSPVAEIDEPRFLDTDRIHRVNAGETLYAIAWIYDLDFLHIARVNNLTSPYTIFPGQILNVDPRASGQPVTVGQNTSPGASTARATPVPQVRSTVQTRSIDSTEAAPAQPSQAPTQTNPVQSGPSVTQQGPVNWDWPASGAIIGRFSAAGVDNKGVNFAGNKGDPVLAAADGEVVYAGSGLLRYGDMVIIKHNDRYLSAYAHNDALLVKEGDRVRRGQQIAQLGSTGVDRNMLHFEIREEGKPVDPLQHLPPRS